MTPLAGRHELVGEQPRALALRRGRADSAGSRAAGFTRMTRRSASATMTPSLRLASTDCRCSARAGPARAAARRLARAPDRGSGGSTGSRARPAPGRRATAAPSATRRTCARRRRQAAPAPRPAACRFATAVRRWPGPRGHENVRAEARAFEGVARLTDQVRVGGRVAAVGQRTAQATRGGHDAALVGERRPCRGRSSRRAVLR